ncbi:4'-phosphopantetheinyl transferase superfamily protein [Nocardioides sp.]|uniref:4'-phosphopantetheinyl transferase family protein n=1 Tax=Nocardioides sp. TaxID=35761 RepID=UPI00286D771E|nr:4'-phosphopantetheinyl transferase superfamily protein [Nocardioides sp.]
MRPDVAWHAASVGAAAALEAHARSLLGPGTVTSGRLCSACGSDAHGRPWVRHLGEPLHVSLSRSGPHLVTAIALVDGGVPVGVDVEVAAIDVLPSLVLAPSEAPGSAGDLARTWARKEAILKARGTGLATPMSTIVLAEETWQDLPAPEGYVAALAGLGDTSTGTSAGSSTWMSADEVLPSA